MKTQETFKLMEKLEKGVDQVDRLLASSGKLSLTLDFHPTRFVSVDGLEWLEELILRGESKAAEVRFINVRPEIYKVFKVSRIQSLLKACGSPPADSGPFC